MKGEKQKENCLGRCKKCIGKPDTGNWSLYTEDDRPLIPNGIRWVYNMDRWMDVLNGAYTVW